MPMKHKDCEERNKPATLTERGLAAIQSPGKPNGLSHCVFERRIVEVSSQAQNHLSVLADRHTVSRGLRLHWRWSMRPLRVRVDQMAPVILVLAPAHCSQSPA